MSSKGGLEPIKYGDELDKGEEVQGELLVASSDPVELFDSLEEVLHVVTEPVEASVPAGGVLAILKVRDAGTAPGIPDPITESSRVVAFVGHQAMA